LQLTLFTNNRYYYHPSGRRFRSVPEILRFFQLIPQIGSSHLHLPPNAATQRGRTRSASFDSTRSDSSTGSSGLYPGAAKKKKPPKTYVKSRESTRERKPKVKEYPVYNFGSNKPKPFAFKRKGGKGSGFGATTAAFIAGVVAGPPVKEKPPTRRVGPSKNGNEGVGSLLAAAGITAEEDDHNVVGSNSISNTDGCVASE